MRCYLCGAELTELDYCTYCGTDVTIYKKIMHISNRFYNEGLARAGVRDLTGAINSLRQAIKLNKNHVDARNLLGLVYFEMGETVAALSEWVVSKNIRPDKNLADEYISDIQSNPTQQEMLDQVVRKYNQALAYCHAESNDYAIVQLKRVVSQYPRFLKAQQLLALLYIEAEDWEKARRVLKRCIQIDVNNTTTLRYIKEVEMMLDGEEITPQKKKGVEKSANAITYQSGNETIIQPRNPGVAFFAPNVFLNILIGVGIGLAIGIFLIMPAKVQSAKSNLETELKQISENSDKKTAEISSLEQQVTALTEENERLKGATGTGEGGSVQTSDSLISTVTAYINNPSDLTTVAEGLYGIDKGYVQNDASEAYRNLYNALFNVVANDISKTYLSSGITLKNQGDYAGSVANLEKAWYFNPTNSEVLYYLAETYHSASNMEKAIELYNQLISTFPESEYASLAEQNVARATSGDSPIAASSQSTTTETTEDN